jgi:hypothetical protein
MTPEQKKAFRATCRSAISDEELTIEDFRYRLEHGGTISIDEFNEAIAAERKTWQARCQQLENERDEWRAKSECR